MAVFLLAVFAAATLLFLTTDDDDVWPVVIYLAFVFVATFVFMRVAWLHGPEPRWRWGRKADDDPDEDY